MDGPIDPTEDVRTFDLRIGRAVPRPAGRAGAHCGPLGSPAWPAPGCRRSGPKGRCSGCIPDPALTPPVADGSFTRRQAASRTWATSSSDAGGQIAAIAAQHESLGEGSAQPVRVVERVVALTARPRGAPDAVAAQRLLDQATGLGFDRLLSEQRRAWALRWADAEIGIEGDPDNELAVRFALFHLMAAAPVTGEAAIGPRGLSGPTYKGHVFWDADVFVLPFLAATCPRAAQAMLRYRIRRLPEARRIASAQGMRGARFPWESARTGSDVTPTHAVSLEGVIPILTGRYEEHITADVAWAAGSSSRGPVATTSSTARRGSLLLDTARYWASRTRLDADGRGHIDAVMGPDEYHELVDDNAFTNVMARWNLRAAARLAGDQRSGSAEAQRWTPSPTPSWTTSIAETQVYEQFTGYFELEAIIVSDIAEPPVAVDLLLGRERIARSQVIKQPDVLMLHHLVPDEVVDGSLQPNLDFYLPRCAHGSSLSPAIHASLLARAGRPDEAMHLFDMACRLDLADLTGTTAGGLHMADLRRRLAGGRQRLRGDPPAGRRTSSWIRICRAAGASCGVRVRFRGARVAVVLRHDEIRLIRRGDGRRSRAWQRDHPGRTNRRTSGAGRSTSGGCHERRTGRGGWDRSGRAGAVAPPPCWRRAWGTPCARSMPDHGRRPPRSRPPGWASSLELLDGPADQAVLAAADRSGPRPGGHGSARGPRTARHRAHGARPGRPRDGALDRGPAAAPRSGSSRRVSCSRSTAASG